LLPTATNFEARESLTAQCQKLPPHSSLSQISASGGRKAEETHVSTKFGNVIGAALAGAALAGAALATRLDSGRLANLAFFALLLALAALWLVFPPVTLSA
jgi:hypothetical protein